LQRVLPLPHDRDLSHDPRTMIQSLRKNGGSSRIENPAECESVAGQRAYEGKNSYNWCAWGAISSRTKVRINNVTVWVKYTAKFHLIVHTYTGNKDNDFAREYPALKSRQFRAWFYLSNVKREGSPGAGEATARTFPFSLGLAFKPSGCSVTPTGLNGFIYKGPEKWEEEGGAYTFTSDLAQSSGPDKVGYCKLQPQLHMPEQVLDPYDYLAHENPVFRCDSSPKITSSKGGCVVWKDSRPAFELSRSAQVLLPNGTLITNPVKESADHIWDAWSRPGATVPLDPQKVIPGFDMRNPLERNTDTSRKGLGGKNRRAAIKQCDRSYSDPRPRPPGVRYTKKLKDAAGNVIARSCDEFPFAATHQGASKAGTNYSVRAILDDDNCTAGSWLGWWFERNRVLEKQKFTVTVLNTQDPGLNGSYPPPVESCTPDEVLVPDSEAP
ncbi:NucA/NucB deoxyribonuclease domain-containing protein, partial [Nonomuraea typhae]